jgi:PPOX class probable F420-dependent enzyme
VIELSSRIQRHLESDVVVWLATAGADRPHAVPVWFWWDGSSFLIYSVPGQKVREMEANPRVQLHLNTDRSGDFVVRFDGEAEILKNHPPATRMRKYIDKYRERILAYGWTTRSFADQYNIAVRIRPTRLRS